ncbi:MAG: hypothetical protein ACRD8W_04215 [Nitrososphaeraceae archaeon]
MNSTSGLANGEDSLIKSVAFIVPVQAQSSIPGLGSSSVLCQTPPPVCSLPPKVSYGTNANPSVVSKDSPANDDPSSPRRCLNVIVC